jgi:acetolactate synthase-1/2/3 large subunit
MPKTTGPRFVADTLKAYGVSHVFFVPQMLLDTLTGMEGMGIRRVLTHGEKAAAYMADGYARASGKPGICMAQHVGASNLAAGLRDAYLACSPVIALTGGPAAARYRHAYQELEDFTQFDHTTKFNARVDHIARLPDMLRQAFREATTGSPGPVHLQIGGHHAENIMTEADLELIVEDRYKQVPPFRPAADEAQVKEALRALDTAERPIIVAGGGVTWSGAQAEVVTLAEKLSVPVATALNAKGCMLDTHPLAVGVCGTYSRTCANRAVAEADLVFYIGSHTGSQVTARWQIPKPGKSDVIQLDIDAREIGRNYPVKHALLGDARTVLRQMLEAAGPGGGGKRAPWLARVKTLVEEWRALVANNTNSDAVPMRPERVCRELSNALPQNAVLVSDTGHSGIWTGALVNFTRPGQRLIRCAGSLGWGFPGAMGVKCALPNTPVVCFAGDGGFYYHLAELETAARYGINLVVIVNNNASLNQEIPHFDKAYGGDPDERGREMWGFTEVNFVKVAESLGCMGIRVERPEQMGPAIEKALAAGKPVVIDTVTDHRAFSPKTWTGGTGDGH